LVMCLTGPPGSGKTLLLGLKAVEWAKAGDVVIIICSKGVNSGSLVSWLLHRRVVQALGGIAPAQPQTDTDRKGNGGHDPGGQKRTEGSERSGVQAEKEPVSKTRRKGRHTQKKRDKEKAPSFAGNVHLEFISTETNVTDLVQTVMQRHGSSGRGVRFVVDEVQMEVTEESQFDRLSGGLHRLRQILELYQEIAEHPGQAGCEKEEETREEQEEKKEETKEQKEEETEKKNEKEQVKDGEKEEQMREEAKKETKAETKKTSEL